MNIEKTRLSLPESLKFRLAGYEWNEITVGCSESKVFRLKHRRRKPLYLKISPDDSFPPLRQEKARLDWLKGKIPVPESLAFCVFNDKSYFLMSEIPGTNAHETVFQGNEREFLRQLVNGLDRIHRVSIENCPFDMRLAQKIKLAEERMKKGLVDESDFDEERAGRTAASLFAELVQTKPVGEDLVFTHGDFCLPNVIFAGDAVSGFVDLGNAGIADKYQDIALLARSVKYNLGAEWTDVLFEMLDAKPDLQKIRFYALLDEFF